MFLKFCYKQVIALLATSPKTCVECSKAAALTLELPPRAESNTKQPNYKSLPFAHNARNNGVIMHSQELRNELSVVSP